MADEGFQEKTEQATPRKRQKAKEKGQVPRSQDLTSMIAMGGIVMIFYFGGEGIIRNLSDISGGLLGMQYGIDPMHVMRISIIGAAKILAPFFLTSLALVSAGSVLQGGFVIKPLKIEIEKLNPISGIKKIFSVRGLTELLKSMLKFFIGGLLIYFILRKDMGVFSSLSAMEMNQIMMVSGRMVLEAIVIAYFFYLAVAIVSYIMEKWQHERSLRMTKQEVKEEHKDTDGDPVVKSRIRSLQREAARKRMMQEVPNATVVITNPTHLAVAIKYEDGAMDAPQIIAKGAGHVAARIKEIALEHGVPVIEDKPIARALFKLELNSFVPEALYVAVARILAYIYKLKGRV